MVNTGRPSTGCFRCRKRRIKCDETKPGCMRCFKTKKECPGYRPRNDVLFHNKTFDGPTRKIEAPKEIKEEVDDDGFDCEEGFAIELDYDAPSCSDSSASTQSFSLSDLSDGEHPAGGIPVHPRGSLSDLTRRAASPRPPPRYSLEHQSFSFFIHLYVVKSTDAYTTPFLAFLPKLLIDSGHTSCVHKATLAVAKVTLANRLGPAATELRRQTGYGEAIQAVNSALRDPKRCLGDDTLMAVWALGLYQLASTYSGDSVLDKKVFPPLPFDWQLHMDGTYSLLRLRGAGQFSTERGRHLFRMAHAAVQMRAILYGQTLADDFCELVEQMYAFMTEETTLVGGGTLAEYLPTGLRVLRYSRQAASILGGVSRASAQDQRPPEEMRDHLRMIEELEEDICGWNDQGLGKPIRVALGTDDPISLQNATFAVHGYSSFLVYLDHTRYFTARVTLHEAAIRLLRSMLGEGGSGLAVHQADNLKLQILNHKNVIQSTAFDVLGSVAYALGDVDEQGRLRPSRDSEQGFNVIATFQVVWPLTALRASEHITPLQRKLIGAALKQINDEHMNNIV